MYSTRTQAKALGLLTGFFACVFVCAAVLAPYVWEAGQWLVLHAGFDFLKPYPFFRYVNRCLMLCVCVALWCSRRQWGHAHVKMLWHRPVWSEAGAFVWAWCVGCVGFGVLWWGLAWASWVVGKPSFDLAWGFAVSAFVVSVLEEWLFRAVLLGWLLQFFSQRVALGVSAVVFAVLHFLGPSSRDGYGDRLDGFRVLGSMFARFLQHDVSTYAAFATLCAVGYGLGVLVCRQKSVWGAVALHASWVWMLKVCVFSTKVAHVPDLWLGESLIEGVLPLCVVCVSSYVCVVSVRWFDSSPD